MNTNLHKETTIRNPPNPQCSLSLEEQRILFQACNDALQSKRDIIQSLNQSLKHEDGSNHYDDSNVDMSTKNEMHNLLASRSPSLDYTAKSLFQVIEQLKTGVYDNHCQSCHQPIPFIRLKAVPHTQHCVICKR